MTGDAGHDAGRGTEGEARRAARRATLNQQFNEVMLPEVHVEATGLLGKILKRNHPDNPALPGWWLEALFDRMWK